MADDLLTPEFLAKVEKLELVSRKILAGRMRGERRSKRKGTSTEFADHRSYVVGDDLRFIDWNILIRLDRLFIKIFEEEEDLHLHLLIDTSKSMDFGDPTKLLYAKRVAAAIGYIGLVNLDRVFVSTFSDDLVVTMPPARGRSSVVRLFDQIANIPSADGSNLAATCKSFSIRNPRKGVVVLISDLLDKEGFEAGLRYLIARQFDVFVIHVLSAEEIDPPVTGDLKLVDCEDGDVAEITVSAPLLARYKRTVEAFRHAAKDYCSKRGVSYLFTINQAPFEQLILTYMRERGLVK